MVDAEVMDEKTGGRQVVILPDMITVDQLQEILDIGKDLAYNLVRRKDFPSIKIGREYRVLTEELRPWLLKQQKNK